jgi:hypothetical protein
LRHFLIARLALISASGIRLGSTEPRSANFAEMIDELSPLTKAIDRLSAGARSSRFISARNVPFDVAQKVADAVRA